MLRTFIHKFQGTISAFGCAMCIVRVRVARNVDDNWPWPLFSILNESVAVIKQQRVSHREYRGKDCGTVDGGLQGG